MASELDEIMPEGYTYRLIIKPPQLVVVKNGKDIKAFSLTKATEIPVEILAKRWVDQHSKNLIN